MADRYKDTQGAGAQGFSQQYWLDNYSEPETMDGIYNARRRAQALHALFESEYIEVGSLIDFGFGLGYLFREMIDVFAPHTVVGLEPSLYAYARISQRPPTEIESIDVTLLPVDLLTWCQSSESHYLERFDLGICTSVLQYLTDSEIEQVIPVLSQRVKYLYFSVPTDVELRYQANVLNFDDTYAFQRSKEEYLHILHQHFTIVSNRVLESKVHFNQENTYFSDLLYRF